MNEKAREVAEALAKLVYLDPALKAQLHLGCATNAIAQAMRKYAVEKLQEAAKRMCTECESGEIPLLNSDNIRIHTSTPNPLLHSYDDCKADKIYDLIAEIEGDEDAND